ncbi:MAG: hypothetical protein QCH96_03910 [Candidatus Thermoplasmatota archaeon]|nr:hypothetical protein [Candidatus Thermoplasmatota archaeon]
MKKYLVTVFILFLLLMIPSISAIEHHEITKQYQSISKQNINMVKQAFDAHINETIDSLNRADTFETINRILEEETDQFFDNKGPLVTRIFDFIRDNGNFSSLNLIMALIGTIIFFILTQPIFLQLIVETGNDATFVVLLLSLIVIEIIQKFFALKVVGVWEPFIVEDIDGFWNFFSIVFFSIYFKIYLSNIPAFIIQYSTVLVKGFFYILMFAIPILFNFFIADALDLIDWNGDESPVI